MTPRGATNSGEFSGRVITGSVLTVSVGVLPGYLPGALAVQIADDIELGTVGLGIVVGAFAAVSALSSPPMGRLAERTGWAPSMRLSALIAALSLIMASFLATSVLSLALIAMIGGLAMALGQPATNLALARATRTERQGFVFGLRHAAVPAAAALAGLAVPLVALPWGWEWVYRIAAVVAVCAAVVIPFHPARYEVNPLSDSARQTKGRPSTPAFLLWVLAIGAALAMMGVDSFAAFIVVYSVEGGFSEAAAGVLLGVGSLIGMSVRLIAGWQIDRRGGGGLPTVAVFLAAGGVGLVLIAVGTQPLIVIGSLIGFLFGFGWAGLFTYAVVRVNPTAPAAATAVTQTGRFIGTALGPVLFGFLAEVYSFTVAWVVMAAAFLASGALMWLSSGPLERESPSTAQGG